MNVFHPVVLAAMRKRGYVPVQQAEQKKHWRALHKSIAALEAKVTRDALRASGQVDKVILLSLRPLDLGKSLVRRGEAVSTRLGKRDAIHKRDTRQSPARDTNERSFAERNNITKGDELKCNISGQASITLKVISMGVDGFVGQEKGGKRHALTWSHAFEHNGELLVKSMDPFATAVMKPISRGTKIIFIKSTKGK